MMSRLLLCVLILLLPNVALAVDFAVVQQASRTTTGTQDFTSSGFGTPKAVFCYVGGGAANGTQVDHALLGTGASDGTRHWSSSTRSQDAVTTTLAGRRSATADMLLMADDTGTVIIRAQYSAWITDGVRINYSVAPGTARLVTCVLFGGTGVSNAYVGTVTTPGVINTGTTVTAPGFQPDLVIGVVSGNSSFDNTNAAQSTMSVGFVTRGSGNPHPQSAISYLDVNAVGTVDQRARVDTDMTGADRNGTQSIEIQDFTSTGFTAMERDTVGARTLGYLAIQLNGLTATEVTITTPTSTGSNSITGLTGKPQFGLLVLSSTTSTDATSADGNAESFGVCAITVAAQSCSSITNDDGVTTTNSDSVTHNRPIFLRKDGATFLDATFTSFDSGQMTVNYGTVNASGRKLIGLFISEAGSSFGPLKRRF